MQSRYQKRPLDYVIYLCKQVIKQDRQGNLHFFVNSVDFISKVIRKAELTPEQVKVICSNSGESAVKNQLKLGVDYPIQQPSDPVKKINFYTSTAFEGCDVFDKVGRTYIVSDASKAHTLMDISTLFVQICGRIRNSIYKTDVVHIYSTTRYSEDLTLEEYIEKTKETLGKAEKLVTDINNVPEDSRAWVLSDIPYRNEKYLTVEDNRLRIDKNLVNIDIMNFKITKQLYKTSVTLCDELKRNGYGVSVKTITVESPSEKLEVNPKARVSFQELFDEYTAIKENIIYSFDNPHYKLEIIESINPLVKEAYDKLGKAEVQRLNYNQTNIRRELMKKLDIAIENKIVKMIDESIPPHISLESALVKSKLQAIYNELGLKRTAKATDLNNWYEIKSVTKEIKGKNTACIIIIRSKFMRLNTPDVEF